MQSVVRTWCLEILLDIVFTKFVIYFTEEISEFRLRSGRYSTRKFKLVSRMKMFDFRWLTNYDKERCYRCGI